METPTILNLKKKLYLFIVGAHFILMTKKEQRY